MFDAALKTSAGIARNSALASQVYRRSLPVLAAAAVALLAGCTTQRDSVTVGSIPDDYRTNHPIVIAEKEQKLDLPVGASDRGITQIQRVALQGFFAKYDRSASPVVNIMVPSGAENDEAAAYASRDFIHVARKSGVPQGRIVVSSYQAQADTSAPIRVTYSVMKAQTDKCGRWPEDIVQGSTAENKHYANFGCSYQNNLAAQMANPADLLGPRKPGDIDVARRDNIIEAYRVSEPNGFGEVDYGN